MAEGGVAPQPPIKRPTRRPFSDVPQGASFTDSDHAPTISSIPKIPARPAPSIPGGRAPPKPPDPGGRVPPKPPSKPPATSALSSQPVPMRGDSTKMKAQQTKIPPRPASVSLDKTAIKRRPEITIVCARPMSEVGFRDQTQNSNQSNKSSASSADQSKPITEVNLRNLPPVPPRTDKKEEDHRRDEKLTTRPSGKPPLIPQQLPSRVPPPTTSLHAPPPSPRPRVAAWNSSSLSDKNPSPSQEEASATNSERSGDTLLQKEPLVALKPVSVCSTKSPEVISQSNSPSDDVIPSAQTQFKKPLRPTIIRPQKKSHVQKPKEEKSSGTELATSKGDEHVNVKEDNTSANIENTEKSSVSPMLRPKPMARERPKSMSIADSVKRFEIKTDSQANVPVIAGKKPPPPLTPKPKPNVLPKPNKPSNTSPSESTPSSSVSSTPTSVVVSPVGTSSSEQLVNSQQCPEKNVQKMAEDVFKPKTQPTKPSKRPTIIRAPPKPKRSSDHSSDDDEEEKDIVKEDEKVEESAPVVVVKRRVKATTDDILVTRSDKAPPLPNKRPVSIAGIPHGFSLPSSGQDEANDLVSNKEQFRPKPVTRGSVAHEAPDHKSHGSHRPKIIGRPPPPVIIKQDPEEKKPSRPEVPNTSQRPKSAVCDSRSRMDEPSRLLPSLGGHPPRRPTSFDPKLTATQGTSKPPLGRPPPPAPRERLTIPGESDDTIKDNKKGKKEGQPSPTLAPKRPPAASPSKVNSRSSVRPDKPQPPRPASMRHTSLPHPLPAGKSSSPPRLPTRPTPGHPLYHYMDRMPHGIALHNFDGVDEGDLSFKATERVLLVSQMDESWLRGKIDDREGIFPAEFIQIVVPLPNQSPPVGPDITDRPVAAWGDDDTQSLKKPDLIGQGPRCCARFDFDGEGENDLQFEEGDYIRLLDKIGDEWAEGEINGCKGVFPLVYVEIIEDLPTKTSEAEHLPPQMSEVPGNSPGHLSEDLKLEPSSEVDVATVMYNFDGSDPGDLPLNVGDMVKVIGIVNEEWLYGQRGEQRGQFPANFIDSIPNNLPPYDPEVKPVTQNTVIESSMEEKSDLPLSDVIYCVALHAFNGEGDDELSFSEGDRILVLENLGSDWCKGKLNNKCGIFPSTFVEMEKKSPGNPPPEKPADVKLPVQYGVALYEFDAMESNELSLKVGDRVLLGDFAADASDWRWGEFGGHSGIFPAAFVELES
ncbi:SH3 domain-containing protein 19-like [Mizuhopecten yessoensis]|uniref:SH3 domain-containing protein 19 n=1 Tax=Mizuhopecten yessoensis TaxID=6573 RepID=A0A210PPR1_MIZYE|nr:SH3 domain-containing protein 19-like [Mizuhopecten yessoensis]OWF38490.1 SH3 domain-containing protein 19 [Mizuhopecten yessoensis]